MALQDEWWLLGGVRTSFVKSCVNADSLADVRGIAMECDWPEWALPCDWAWLQSTGRADPGAVPSVACLEISKGEVRSFQRPSTYIEDARGRESAICGSELTRGTPPIPEGGLLGIASFK